MKDKKGLEYVTMTKEKVLVLLYPGKQLIECESSIDHEPLRDRVNQSDIRRYVSVHFIHLFKFVL